MIFRKSLLLCIIICLLINVSIGDDTITIGDECHHHEKNVTGQCTSIDKCDFAIKELIQNKKQPQTCGFQGLVHIICCPLLQPGLIAEKKCWEYSESVYKIIPSPDPFVSKEPLNISTCTTGSVKLFPFGDGCLRAKEKEFPHMVVLGFGRTNNKKWKCSGTLISEQFVLTAAHCINLRENGEVKFIRLAELNLATLNDADPQDFYVKEIFQHPNYSSPSRYNDIALLKMDRPTRFNEFIRPACLQVTKDIPGNRYTVTGWNQKDAGEEKQSERLQKMNKYSLSADECKITFTGSKISGLKNGINSETQLCASNKESENLCEVQFKKFQLAGDLEKFCQLETMDTGGPLQIFHPKAHCMYSVVGVNSFGKFLLLDVYTRVSHYIDWIEQIVWP